jgi:hypothetical protein
VRTALVLLLVATVVALLLAEGAFRIAERTHCQDRMGGFVVRNRLWGWGHRAGARGWAQGCSEGKPEWRAYTRINRHGLRDREIPHERTGGFRILVLGDSFTAAMQVEQEATFVKLLERRLAASAPLGSGVEVLNAGVSGWGTDNALLFFQHEGWRYRPDLVLLAFCTVNDVWENARELVASNPFWPDKPYFALVDDRLVLEHFPLAETSLRRRVLVSLAGSLALDSALFRRASAVPQVMSLLLIPPPDPLVPGGPVDTVGVYLEDYPEVWQRAWRITFGLVHRLREDVEKRGARFAVTVINGREVVSPRRWNSDVLALRPALQGVAMDPAKPDRLMTRFLAQRGIPTIPLLDEFRVRFGDDAMPGYFARDGHWAPAGHALAAQRIAAGLHQLALVPADGPAGR